MILKKKKAVISAILAAAMTAASVMPSVVSADSGKRTKPEAYGDGSYVERFLSLYDDVVTHGQETGYLSSQTGGGDSFGIPYHAIEELIVEAPDYGHETTSEAMSYIVWMAAMRDVISKDGSITLPDGSTKTVDKTSDLAKAWKTMEVMIPTEQSGIWGQDGSGNNQLSAQYSEEHEDPETYPTDQDPNNKGINPIHSQYASIYKNDKGLYLMHWLADVEDWYGYGSATGNAGKFTFINTFQRGEQESCWETVPHACIETLKFGDPSGKRGIKGIFSTEDEIAKQWSYTNAPDAEDRAIQGVYYANRMGAGNAEVTALAGKMGDQLRNNMFDKYYKKIGCQNAQSPSASGYDGAHFLMSWYTSWGGALDKQWAWQIGASHCHEFYQNPLAAYALLADEGLKAGMKTGQQAVKDYEESLVRQLEFYLWLQSADGPIAGGATSSWRGRYEKYEYNAEEQKKYNATAPTTFYDMAYLEHPVYADPGSNHWIGNQVWAVQRLAELYYDIQKNGDKLQLKVAGNMSISDALKAILDRWVEWFVNNTELTADGEFKIPASLDWFGQPANWNGKYDPNANAGLTCKITAMGSSDLGCVSSLCNSLIYYAAANGVETEAAYTSKNTDVAAKGLYIAHALLDREWELGRDDWGLSLDETNGNMHRLFETEVWIPNGQDGKQVTDPVSGNTSTKFQNKIKYTGTMPNGEELKTGIVFIDIRQKYVTDGDKGTYDNNYFQKFKAAYDTVDHATGMTADGKTLEEAMQSVTLNYHRFWHAGDILMSLGTMYELYPDMEADRYDDVDGDELVIKPSNIVLEVGDSEELHAYVDDDELLIDTVTADSDAITVNGTTITAAKPSDKPVKVTVTSNGMKATVSVTIKDSSQPTTNPDGPTAPSGKATMWGDVDLNKKVEIADVVRLNQYIIDDTFDVDPQGLINGNCQYDEKLDIADSSKIIDYIAMVIEYEQLGDQMLDRK